MLGLYLSLALLGLSAIDPIGIGIMPMLLVQKHPYRRSFVFLSGSFFALMLMGLLFARGLGEIILRFEHHNSWFIPTIETIAGAILLIIAIVAYVQIRNRKISTEPSEKILKWLRFGYWNLFLLGAGLVTALSIIDVVFVIAMVRVGQFQLSYLSLSVAVAIYSTSALALQIAVVGAYRFASVEQKAKTLQAVQRLLVKYSHQTLIIVSLCLSGLMFSLAAVSK